MKNYYLTIFLFFGLLFCDVGFRPSLSWADDISSWNKYQIEKRINDNWKIYTGEQVKFREFAGFYYEETSVGSDYRVSRHLTLGAAYFQTHSGTIKAGEKVWSWIYKPKIYVTPQVSFSGFTMEDRNLLEYHFVRGQKDVLLYRNMVTLTAPWKWTRLEIQPYTANEIFKQTDRGGLVEDRIYGGFKMRWWGPVYGRIFYLRDLTKSASGQWGTLNVVGTDMTLVF